MQRDSVLGTFVVATVLCVVCSLMVSGTAEVLRSRIKENERLDRKKNILIAAQLAGASAPPSTVNEVYDKQVEQVWIDLQTGEVMPVSELPGEDAYDPGKAANDPKLNVAVKDNALMGIRDREPYAPVYKVFDPDKESGNLAGYVLPIYGNGLWGTLWGFLALEADAHTVKGITFYKHKETPGLGAEVDNPNWKAQWPGKVAIGQDGDVMIQVKKGSTPADSPQAAYTIDGLSGATITTKGVDHLVRYWLGDEGFGKYLAKQ